MVVGVSIQTYWNNSNFNLIKTIRHVTLDLNFECVEILCENPVFPGWSTKKSLKTREEIKKTLKSLGNNLKVSLHAPFHDLSMASLNEGVRHETARQIKECIETARYLDSERIVVHPGYASSSKYHKDLFYGLMIRELEDIVDYAKYCDIEVCLENLASKAKALCVQTHELQNVFRRVKGLKMALDVAHANTTGVSPLEFVKKLRKQIRHVHLSDNNSDNSHLPIGLGGIDFEGVLRKLKPYDGFYIIEGWMPRNQDHFISWDKQETERILERIT